MNPHYIEFNGKHPAARKENRVYSDAPGKNWNRYGVSYSSEFLKVDIDDYNHKTGEIEDPIHGSPRSDTIVTILDSLGIRYNGIATEHGKHLFFRVPDDLEQKNKGSRWLCPLGIKCEWKFPASDDHIPLKVNGVERKFFKGSIDNTEIDELPFFLYPLQMDNASFKVEFPEGERTQRLGAYLFYLIKKGYDAEQAFKIIKLMNKFIFESPIPEDALNAEILNDRTKEKLQEQHKQNSDKGSSASTIAKEIIDCFKIITVNGDFYSYENGVYKPFSGGKITQYLTTHHPTLTANFEREVNRHISGLTYTEPPEDDGTVNVKNGILSFSLDGAVSLSPHTMEHISFKQFNANYDPKAKNKLLDDNLLLWFNGSSKQIELFYQLLGYLLMNHVNYQKVFFFVGAPSTGKTTLLKLIIAFCGDENISAIQLEDMGKPFALASIVNKTANVFSDIRKTKVLASETFKMLADGSPLEINRKFKKGFTYRYTGKLLFGMNSYPDFSRDFDGIERRLIIFEFKHVFKKDDPQFDPAILESLNSEECMSALLNKAISGYKSLIKNKGFVTTKESERSLSEFVSDNDNVVKWLNESEITEDYLLREPINSGLKGSYREYQGFCMSLGEDPKEQKDFSRTICNKFGFETRTKRINGSRVQMFDKKKH